jgi:DNA repair protein RecN (Recombination protein N)
MLAELLIRDLALIERADLAFGPGLNVITGETGAGKSLLVGALELLLGAKPKPGRVRTGAAKATVEARFVLEAAAVSGSLARWARRYNPELGAEWKSLRREGTRGEERELILGRSLTADGRTRSYVNNRPVTREALLELAPRLFEIHGQNDPQRLHDPAEQLRLLDGFGKLEAPLRAYREARAKWQSLVDEALRLEREAADRGARLDLARFQLSELAAAAPDPEEKARLEPEREILRHAAAIGQGLAQACEDLSDADGSAQERIRRAQRFLETWKGQVSALAEPFESLAEAEVHLSDASRALRSLGERLETDPERLEQVEARLAELERLERKYKTDVAGLAARRHELEGEVARLESDEAKHGTHEAEIAAARAAVLARGGELRRARKALRSKLVKAVESVFRDLGLANARFDVKLGQRGDPDSSSEGGLTAANASDPAVIDADRARFGERGIDRIEFVLSANPGEPLQKLRQVASGGETSRIMLALRSALADAGEKRTLLFDEIDAGVGGRLGPVVGAHLAKLGRFHQVLCVTHLPAIAAMADKHLKATKRVEGGRTVTRVEELSGEPRVLEIADMIAGGAAHETAKAEARRLLGLAS